MEEDDHDHINEEEGMVMMIIDEVLEDQDDHNLSHHDHGDV